MKPMGGTVTYKTAVYNMSLWNSIPCRYKSSSIHHAVVGLVIVQVYMYYNMQQLSTDAESFPSDVICTLSP